MGWSFITNPNDISRTGDATAAMAGMGTNPAALYKPRAGRQFRVVNGQLVAADSQVGQNLDPALAPVAANFDKQMKAYNAAEQAKREQSLRLLGFDNNANPLPTPGLQASAMYGHNQFGDPVVTAQMQPPIQGGAMSVSPARINSPTAHVRSDNVVHGLFNTSYGANREAVQNDQTLIEQQMLQDQSNLAAMNQAQNLGLNRAQFEYGKQQYDQNIANAKRMAAVDLLQNQQNTPPEPIAGLAEKMGQGSLQGLDEGDFTGGYGGYGGMPMMGNGMIGGSGYGAQFGMDWGGGGSTSKPSKGKEYDPKSPFGSLAGGDSEAQYNGFDPKNKDALGRGGTVNGKNAPSAERIAELRQASNESNMRNAMVLANAKGKPFKRPDNLDAPLPPTQVLPDDVPVPMTHAAPGTFSYTPGYPDRRNAFGQTTPFVPPTDNSAGLGGNGYDPEAAWGTGGFMSVADMPQGNINSPLMVSGDIPLPQVSNPYALPDPAVTEARRQRGIAAIHAIENERQRGSYGMNAPADMWNDNSNLAMPLPSSTARDLMHRDAVRRAGGQAAYDQRIANREAQERLDLLMGKRKPKK